MSKKDIDPLHSLIAGSLAGAVEASITYPFEFAKTSLQLTRNNGEKASRNPIKLLYRIAKCQGIKSIYTGCPAFIVGNTAKAGIRFLSFDSIKKVLKKPGATEVTSFNGFVAGLGAGVLESVAAVTPFEALKTALIDDKNLRFRDNGQNTVRNYYNLLRELGFRGLYRGLLPVTMRQAANQAVRLGSYNNLKNLAMRWNKSSAELSSATVFAIGSVSGIITVYSTMPIDTVKTRMQGLEASKLYTSTWNCFAKIWQNEGLTAFWKGTTPRLGRLVLSGGIVFTIYEKILLILN